MTILSRHYMVFFFNDTATTEIYTLSLHDALPICRKPAGDVARGDGLRELDAAVLEPRHRVDPGAVDAALRSEEHTSELQSRQYLVCRLLLEKKKQRLCPQQSSLLLCRVLESCHYH